VTMVQLDSENPRSLRGVALAAQAASWLRIRLADGRTGYGMPSTADPLHYWLTSTDFCSCPDHRFRQVACGHIFAARLFEVLSGVPVSQPAKRESSDALWARFEGE
jgi:hypothetical protein